MLDRRTVLLGSLAAGVSAAGEAQMPPPARTDETPLARDPHDTIELWPKGFPGRIPSSLVETVDERSHDPGLRDRAVHGITRPRLAVFRPARPNGAAALVMPGGGYRWVVLDKEGYEIARLLAIQGWTVFVLFYRLPGEGWDDAPNVPLADAQRAMRIIRERAADFGIHPNHIAAMGFSAGGHVCGELATRFATQVYPRRDAIDLLDARPDLAALLYAVQSMHLPLAHPGSRELLLGNAASPALERQHSPNANVSAAMPPCFLLHAEDDPTVPIGNTLEMREALKRAGVAVETHLFERGGHGFGLRFTSGKPVALWPSLFVEWARSHGIG